jgi:hypothetical protein
MLTILAFLGGTLLAFRFNVLILLPTIPFGWMLVLVGGVVAGSSGSSIALRMALVTIVLQVGYMAGIVLIWAWLVSWHRSWSEKPAVVPNGTF